MRALAAACALGLLVIGGACGKKGSPVRPDGRAASLPETDREAARGRAGVVEIEDPDAAADPSVAEPAPAAE